MVDRVARGKHGQDSPGMRLADKRKAGLMRRWPVPEDVLMKMRSSSSLHPRFFTLQLRVDSSSLLPCKNSRGAIAQLLQSRREFILTCTADLH